MNELRQLTPASVPIPPLVSVPWGEKDSLLPLCSDHTMGRERFSVLVPLYPLQLQVAEAGQG